MRKWWGKSTKRARITAVTGGVFSAAALAISGLWIALEIVQRGLWDVVTGLAPTALGVGTVAVSVAAIRVSRTIAAADAARAEREINSAERARRMPLAKSVIVWVFEIGDAYTEQARGRRGTIWNGAWELIRELELHEGTEDVVALVSALREAYESVHRFGKPRTSEAQGDRLLRNRWATETRRVLSAWATDPRGDGLQIRALIDDLPARPASEAGKPGPVRVGTLPQ